jgi:hypothetical protein
VQHWCEEHWCEVVEGKADLTKVRAAAHADGAREAVAKLRRGRSLEDVAEDYPGPESFGGEDYPMEAPAEPAPVHTADYQGDPKADGLMPYPEPEDKRCDCGVPLPEDGDDECGECMFPEPEDVLAVFAATAPKGPEPGADAERWKLMYEGECALRRSQYAGHAWEMAEFRRSWAQAVGLDFDERTMPTRAELVAATAKLRTPAASHGGPSHG